MKAYSELTHRGQTARLRRLAHSVLPDYPLTEPRMITIGRGFNTTFRVDADDRIPTPADNGYFSNRYLLRVHRSGWHGAENNTHDVVESELRWLAALRRDTSLIVPEPIRTVDGHYTSEGRFDGVPTPRVCSMLRWVKGRFFAETFKPIHLKRVGALTAQLHNHAAAWRIPVGFVRPQWTWDAFFGDAIGYTSLSADEVWGIVPATYRSVLEGAAAALRPIMSELGTGPEVWGLIHADLHLENVLFAGSEARPIDFDDCGFGYWIYDIAVALWELRLEKEWQALLQAFLDGYARHRPVPDAQLPYLEPFMAGREAMIGLVIAAETHVVPAYREYLDEDMRGTAERIEAILSSN